MIPFLKHIAKTFIEQNKHDLQEYCFIFSNKRGGSFFRKYLQEMVDDSIVFPKITTITDFVSDITETVDANRLDLLFILYQEYSKYLEEAVDFDQFIYWGDMILSDFNDVDKYLADAKQLFSNVNDLKEINSNYLTEEQISVLKEFFGDFDTPASYTETFWRHTHNPNDNQDTIKHKFLKLWGILYPLYIDFQKALISQGLSYSGMTYRKAVEVINGMQPVDFEHTKYIFVGFNMLSTSEFQIFKKLRDKEIADFYWDCNSPFFKNEYNKGSKFLKLYTSQFKSLYDIGEAEIMTYPNINIISSPSNIGQAKYTATIIKELINEGSITDTANAINTAIVLPDEELFLPTLSSIPQEISNTNITMGLPMKYTSIVALMNSLSLMHTRARIEKGECSFFYEDVKTVVLHPYIKSICAKSAELCINEINKKKIFYVSSSFLINQNDSYASIFKPVVDLNKKVDIIEYVRSILALVEYHIIQQDEKSIELGFINKYATLVNQLALTVNNYNIEMKEKSFFFLLDRLISSSTISFEGEPLNGLQIMGVLETRTLDFENVILLSMNEKVFPRKHFSKSFIPNNLRKGFGLATLEYQESIYSYYFFRLLSRAKNVYLVYDSRTEAIGSGEPSRYIYQLKHLYRKYLNIKSKAGTFAISTPSSCTIEIEKNSKVLEKLYRYTNPNSKKYLSASSINCYIDCPLKFYFEKVEDLRVDEDNITGFIDSSTFGTIVHDVMHDLYSSVPPNNNGQIFINKAVYSSFQVDKIITKAVNNVYLKNGYNCYEPLEGESILIGDIVKYYVNPILEYDKSLGDFIFEQGEIEEHIQWKISDSLSINFKQFIDRVDTICNTGIRRIVDYKTGNDAVKFTSIDSLFEQNGSGIRNKAILQLMLYCNVYSQYHGYDGIIQPTIYSIKKKEFLIKNGKNIFIDYHEINNEFLEQIFEVIHEIFDPEIPFIQANNTQTCQYCNFSDICHR